MAISRLGFCKFAWMVSWNLVARLDCTCTRTQVRTTTIIISMAQVLKIIIINFYILKCYSIN